jgi:eukaryotic-like serine/threonine-protein kinase
LYGAIAPGEQASVYYGRLLGAGGFSRTVAIKHIDPRWTESHGGAHALLAQTRALTRVRHPNVVPTIDVVEEDEQLYLVMDYVAGETLDRLLAPLAVRGERVPPRIACALVAGVLRGLHAAHEAKSSRGEPLGIVHGDVSPRNVLVGGDGTPRILDFGFPRPALPYAAPEQARGETTPRSDIFGAGMILWEALTGRSALSGAGDAETIESSLVSAVDVPSKLVLGVPREVDSITLRALRPEPSRRYASAKDMARDLEACIGSPADAEIAAWVAHQAGPELERRAAAVAHIERDGVETASRPPLARAAPPPFVVPAPLPPVVLSPSIVPPSGPPTPMPRREGAALESTADRQREERLSLAQLLGFALIGFTLVAAIGFVLLLLRASRPASQRGPAAPSSLVTPDASRE